MRRKRLIRMLGGVAVVMAAVGLIVTAFMTRDRWLPFLKSAPPPLTAEEPPVPLESSKVLKLSPEARKNLKLVSKPVVLQNYWRTIQVPGVVVDRPGLSDWAITSPAVGVVTQVHALTGDTVRPGEKLFTLRLSSEYMQDAQAELLKAAKETQLVNEERARIEGLVERGVVPEKRLFELDQQIRRQAGLIQAYRQGLVARGIAPSQIAQIAEGEFVDTIDVVAPASSKNSDDPDVPQLVADVQGFGCEVQDLKVDVGQQVQAGQLLSVLSDHKLLYIEGHAFRQEAPLLENAAQNGWPIKVEFTEDNSQHWPPLEQTFQIRHLGNKIDTVSRTFDFFIALTNQSRSYEQDGETFVVWRFRPGQRARLHVPIGQFENVIVLPAAALIREGPEAFVFRQNGDLFKRIPVYVLHEDRLNVVLANDGSVAPGLYLAQGSAASLNRVLKSQAASGVRADVHVHADGTVHGSH